MAGSIETYFNLVKTKLEAGLPSPQQGVIKWRFGGKYVHESTNWPRIVCVHKASEYAPLTQAGTRLTTAETCARYTRRATLDWHLWASNKENAEILAANVVVSQRRAAGMGSNATYLPGSETWPQAEDEDVTSGGSYVVLSSVIVHEITDEVIALTTIEISTQTHIGKFNDEQVC